MTAAVSAVAVAVDPQVRALVVAEAPGAAEAPDLVEDLVAEGAPDLVEGLVVVEEVPVKVPGALVVEEVTVSGIPPRVAATTATNIS
jgi:hypothetical protein